MSGAALVLLLVVEGRTLTLDEVVRAAESNQPLVHQSHADATAGEARADRARAPLLPEVKLQAEYQRTTGNREHKPGSATNVLNATGTYNWFDLGVTGSWVLWDFGQTRNRWHAAEASARGLAFDAGAARLRAVLDARAAYFRARAHKTLVAVAREALANQERHLAQVDGFVTAGARPAIDLAQARAGRANARVQLIDAENAYASARAELNQAMGVAGPIDYDVGDESFAAVDAETQPVATLVDEALRARPERAALDAQIAGQQLARRAARAGYGPTLSLIAGASDQGTDLTRTSGIGLTSAANRRAYNASQLAWNYFGGVRLEWSFLQGLATSAEIREADALLASLRARRDALEQQIWVAVEQAQLGVRAAQEAVSASGEVLAATRERLTLAEGRYQAGAGNAIELGDAQLAAVSSAAQKVGAEYRLATARAQLLFALGRR
ncbi:MAG TPA: TolC family protein [Polyangia bacterium]|nr:TolC family protein [Polyangia bacterium]